MAIHCILLQENETLIVGVFYESGTRNINEMCDFGIKELDLRHSLCSPGWHYFLSLVFCLVKKWIQNPSMWDGWDPKCNKYSKTKMV